MTTTTAPTSTTATSSTTRPIWRTAAIAGAVAAVATTVIGVIAKAADVPLVVGDMDVQIPAFAIFTLIGAALGGLLATQLHKRTTRPRRTFLVTTVALTAVSFVPDLTAEATTATKLTLLGAHIVAAAIIIPALARRLADSRTR